MREVESLWETLDERLLPLLRRYRRNVASLHVDTKPDDTLLSEADLATQTLILFYRPDQKVWDGVAGIGLAIVMGRAATDGHGKSPLPLDEDFLSRREPTFAETVAGDPECVRWFVEILAGISEHGKVGSAISGG